MSEHKYYFVSGVFKLDAMYAGFPDLVKICHEWSEDTNFYSLIVRSVSENNFGIDFTYFAINPEQANIMKDKYSKELKDKFGEKALYAWDVATSKDTTLERIQKSVIVHKQLSLDQPTTS